ncbi:MAG TPA: transcriptional repressor LexA [Planctomycetota bacterium]|nr:transcriptional repressor LexA [Planctomycetota bacterium]
MKESQHTDLTTRQRAIFSYIAERVQSSGRPPTVREIGEKFNLSSTGSVRTHLRALIRKGYISTQAGISRGITILKPSAARQRPAKPRSTPKAIKTLQIPVVGRVAAGPPILAVEDIQEILELDEQLAPSHGELFALHVRGDSMIDAGIHDGDYVFIRPQKVAQKGDMIVAIVDGEATIKTYFPANGKIRLQPANDKLQPILIDPSKTEFQIVGKVTGMMRRF